MFSCCPFGSAQGRLFRLSAFASSTISSSPGICVFLAVHLVRTYDPDTLSSLPVSALNVWFAVSLTVYLRRLRAFLYPGDRDSTRQLLHSCSERSRTYWLSLSLTPVFLLDNALYPTSPSLRWVAWVSLPHLHWYYARLRLPIALLDALCSRSVTDTLFAPFRLCPFLKLVSGMKLRANAWPAWSPGTPFPGG